MRGLKGWRVLAAAAVTCGVVSGAVAEPMAKEACDAAEAERSALLAGGIQETVKKGPAWAKANLPPQKLKDVERYIALQEQLLFKCGQAKLRTLPLNDGEDGEGPGTAKEAAPGDEAKKPPTPKPKPKPAPRKAAAPKAEASSAPGSAVAADPATTPKAAPKPRPKPKPKVDDAYRPPKPIPQPATE
jgi:hypothetical protein